MHPHPCRRIHLQGSSAHLPCMAAVSRATCEPFLPSPPSPPPWSHVMGDLACSWWSLRGESAVWVGLASKLRSTRVRGSGTCTFFPILPLRLFFFLNWLRCFPSNARFNRLYLLLWSSLLLRFVAGAIGTGGLVVRRRCLIYFVRYKLFDKWWKEKGFTSTSAGAGDTSATASRRSKFAWLTQDPCFWARVEEARVQTESAKAEREAAALVMKLKSLREFERYSGELVESKDVSIDVIAPQSSYTLWVEEWKELKLRHEVRTILFQFRSRNS